MRKKLVALLLAGAMAMSMMACGESEAESTEESSKTTEAAETTDDSVDQVDRDYEYDVDDYVTLGDYKGIEVTLTDSYEVTEDSLDEYIENQVESTIGYQKDDSQTEVKSDSIVNVDYVGKQNGEAFSGGTATDQTLDVAGNCDATSKTGFIDGFTAGLVGAKVGDEIDCEVTFPDNYGATDLAGQTVTFTFTINWIGKEITADDLTDDMVKEYFDYDTVDDFETAMEEALEADNEESRESDIRTAVLNTVQNNATVTGVPENLLLYRLDLYVSSMETSYCSDGQTLQEYLESLGQDYDSFIDNAKSSISESLEQELVFEAVAKAENIEIDQTEYDEYVAEIVDRFGLDSKDKLFEVYSVSGYNGEDYIKHTFLLEQGLNFCIDNAVVK